MYRCYLLREGRIVKAENLDVATLEDAIIAGRQLLTAQAPSRGFRGIEIWHGASLLYSDIGDDVAGTRERSPRSLDEAAFVHAASEQSATLLQR